MIRSLPGETAVCGVATGSGLFGGATQKVALHEIVPSNISVIVPKAAPKMGKGVGCETPTSSPPKFLLGVSLVRPAKHVVVQLRQSAQFHVS